MSNGAPSQSPTIRKSALKSSSGSRNIGAIAVPKLAASPVLQPNTGSDLGIPLSKSTIRPASPVRNKGYSPVRQSGSPERRLRILELEAKVQKPSIAPQRLGPISPEKPVKKARFADDNTEESENGNLSQKTLDMLSEIPGQLKEFSLVLTTMAQELKSIRETQDAHVAEIAQLKETVASLKRKSSD